MENSGDGPIEVTMVNKDTRQEKIMDAVMVAAATFVVTVVLQTTYELIKEHRKAKKLRKQKEEKASTQ